MHKLVFNLLSELVQRLLYKLRDKYKQAAKLFIVMFSKYLLVIKPVM